MEQAAYIKRRMLQFRRDILSEAQQLKDCVESVKEKNSLPAEISLEYFEGLDSDSETPVRAPVTEFERTHSFFESFEDVYEIDDEGNIENDDSRSLIQLSSAKMTDTQARDFLHYYFKRHAIHESEPVVPIPSERDLPGSILLASGLVAVPEGNRNREMYKLYPESGYTDLVQRSEVEMMEIFDGGMPR